MWNTSFLSAPSGRVSLARRPRTENSTAPWLIVGRCQVMESFLFVTLQPSPWKAPPFWAPLVEPPRRESSSTTCCARAACASHASHATVITTRAGFLMVQPPIQGGLQESRESAGFKTCGSPEVKEELRLRLDLQVVETDERALRRFGLRGALELDGRRRSARQS